MSYSSELQFSRQAKIRHQFFYSFEVNNSFFYDENEGVLENLQCLAIERRWNKEKKKQQRGILDALIGKAVLQDLNKLETLQAICRRHNLEIPDSIKKAKEIIKKQLHINIYDYIDGTDISFPTVKQLAVYSEEEGKVYPRHLAKENPELRVLLRYIARRW